MSDKVGVMIKPIVRRELDQYRDGYRNSRNWRQYNRNLNVTKLTIQPNPFQRSITFRANITSEEPRDPNSSIGAVKNVKRRDGSIRRVRKRPAPKRFIKYLVTVRFHEVDFRDSETKQFNQKWTVAGSEHWSRVIAIGRNSAMLKCQCRDFLFSFEKPLADNGGLWPNNRWTRYQRLTPLGPSGYPRRNPKEKMGYCKHIATFLQYLYDSGFLRN